MSDIDKTARVAVVTPVNPGRPAGRREPTVKQRRDHRSEPDRKPLPKSGDEEHQVDDYA